MYGYLETNLIHLNMGLHRKTHLRSFSRGLKSVIRHPLEYSQYVNHIRQFICYLHVGAELIDTEPA